MRLFRATANDVPRIMECAREFTSEIPHCTLSEESYEKFWREALNSFGAMFLLEDGLKVVGGIGGILNPNPLTGIMSAVEMFWYVKPAYRKGTASIRLLREFEKWAANVGCGTVSMVHMECSMPERLKEFYLKFGYSLYETCYIKKL